MQAAPTSNSERTSQSFCQLDESGFGGCHDNVTCLTTAPSVKTDGGETVEGGGFSAAGLCVICQIRSFCLQCNWSIFSMTNREYSSIPVFQSPSRQSSSHVFSHESWFWSVCLRLMDVTKGSNSNGFFLKDEILTEALWDDKSCVKRRPSQQGVSLFLAEDRQ